MRKEKFGKGGKIRKGKNITFFPILPMYTGRPGYATAETTKINIFI